MDAQRNVDRCRFGDYQGKILYEDDYGTCNEQPPVPDESLWLKPSTTTSIYLQNGDVLIEVSLCEAYKKGVAKPSAK
jgi:hypothetical protein